MEKIPNSNTRVDDEGKERCRVLPQCLSSTTFFHNQGIQYQLDNINPRSCYLKGTFDVVDWAESTQRLNQTPKRLKHEYRD